MSKFQRSYRIEIDLADGETVTIIPPITINFTVTRRYQSSLNTLQLSIYNLGKTLRDSIFQDFFDVKLRDYKAIRLYAGYENLSLIYSGDIFEAFSERQGTDIVTHITGKAGIYDLNNSYTYQTLGKGTTVKNVLEYLISQFDFLEKGAVGGFDDVLERPVVLNGQTYDLIKRYSDNKVMIDNGRVYVLKENEIIDGNLSVVDNSTGILTTPRRSQGILQVTTLFEPRLIVGQKATFRSSIDEIFNGVYKIIGISHTGIISESVSGACTTTIDFLVADEIFRKVES